jgi:uncharacterized membrane protein (UPF0127 family)
VAERALGLLGRRRLDPLEGLWLPVRSVHTVGMRVRLDLVWFDVRGAPLRVDVDVGPGRLRTCLRAAGGVVEVAAGRSSSLVAALCAVPGGRAYSSSWSWLRVREPR